MCSRISGQERAELAEPRAGRRGAGAEVETGPPGPIQAPDLMVWCPQRDQWDAGMGPGPGWGMEEEEEEESVPWGCGELLHTLG